MKQNWVRLPLKHLLVADFAAIVVTLCGVAAHAQTLPLQLAGDMIVDLRSTNLSSSYTVWTNLAGSSGSVSNFTNLGGTTLNVTYSTTPKWNGNSINALFVNGSGTDVNNAVQSQLWAPAEITNNGPCSVEGWIYLSNQAGLYSSTVVGWGIASNSTDPNQSRMFDFDYFTGTSSGCFSSDFTASCNWNPTNAVTNNQWFYLAWTYDGTNINGYTNGYWDTNILSAGPFATAGAPIGVGACPYVVPSIGLNPFKGWIAAVRVQSGVLTTNQVLSNYNAGLLAVPPVILDSPTASPGQTVNPGTVVTLSLSDQENVPFTYQWWTDNGTGGATWTAIAGATGASYLVSTANMVPGSYQYRIALTNSTYSISVTSSPVALTINTVAPTLAAGATPGSLTNFTVTAETFTAAFSGDPLYLQWQVSADQVHWTAVTGADEYVTSSDDTTNSVTVSTLVGGTSYYRLQASNQLGTNYSAIATNVVVAPPVPLQMTGDLIVNLQSMNLSNNYKVWTNQTGSANSVGNFTNLEGTSLNATYGTTPQWNGKSISALFVNGSGTIVTNAVQSQLWAPAEITNNGPCSVEGWIYLSNQAGLYNSTVVGWGIASNSSDPNQSRMFDFDYFSGTGSGCFSSDFTASCNWNPTNAVTNNQWFYLAWTYDGTNINGYTNGQWNTNILNAGPFSTAGAPIGVGACPYVVPSIGLNPFKGWIAAVRVQSGVLTTNQILSNYNAGLLAVPPVIMYAPAVSPTNVVGQGTNVTVTLVDEENVGFAYQWWTDNGTGGVNWTPITGANSSNYVVNTGVMPAGSSFQYYITLTNSIVSACATSPPVTVTALGPQLLVNPSFLTPYNNGVAYNWTNHFYKVLDGVNMTGFQDTVNPHSGAYSQGEVVTGVTTNGAILGYQNSKLVGSTNAAIYQQFQLQAGHVYNASVWLRASNTPATAQFALVDADDYYYQGASKILTLTDTNWHQAIINGGWQTGTNAWFAVYFWTNGSFWVADASLYDVTPTYLNEPMVNSTTTITSNFFGLTYNKIPSYIHNWGALGEGIIRIWSDQLSWYQVETNNDDFAWWSHFDAVMDTIHITNSPDMPLLFTASGTPTWAESTIDQTWAPSYYGDPTNMLEWSNFIWTVGNRYNGQIEYWEINNEADSWYIGAITNAVKMVQIAKEVLTNLNSNNKVMGPNLDQGYGIGFLEQVIQAYTNLGGPYPDIISFHDYQTSRPESSLGLTVGLKDMLARYPQFASLPLWCSEGAPTMSATPAQDAAIAARCYLNWWVQNVVNFDWYCWDITNVNGNTTVPLSTNAPTTVMALGGIAYSNVATWLVGSQMTGRVVDTNGTWMVAIQQGGVTNHIVWNPDIRTNYPIPASWGVNVLVDVLGNQTNMTGSNFVCIGDDPCLLYNTSEGPLGMHLSLENADDGNGAVSSGGSPDAAISNDNGIITLSWPASGTLMAATNLAGPWLRLTNTSPYVLTPTPSRPVMYFIVRYGQ